MSYADNAYCTYQNIILQYHDLTLAAKEGLKSNYASIWPHCSSARILFSGEMAKCIVNGTTTSYYYIIYFTSTAIIGIYLCILYLYLLYTRCSCLGEPALSGSFDIRSPSATAIIYYNTRLASERDEQNIVYNKLNLHQASGALYDREENRPTIHA